MSTCQCNASPLSMWLCNTHTHTYNAHVNAILSMACHVLTQENRRKTLRILSAEWKRKEKSKRTPNKTSHKIISFTCFKVNYRTCCMLLAFRLFFLFCQLALAYFLKSQQQSTCLLVFVCSCCLLKLNQPSFFFLFFWPTITHTCKEHTVTQTYVCTCTCLALIFGNFFFIRALQHLCSLSEVKLIHAKLFHNEIYV